MSTSGLGCGNLSSRLSLSSIKYLQDIQTGLWFHGTYTYAYSPIISLISSLPLGWTFDGRHHFGKARWGRGNCWVTVAIPDFVEMLKLPETDGVRKFLVTSLLAQINALVKCQDQATGLWHTILDDETSYLESSCTAGFAYGIMKALRLRLIPKEERYTKAAKKAIEGVLGKITPKGELQSVSFGTPVFDDVERYKTIPLTSMPYGQSLAILALTEYLRTFI